MGIDRWKHWSADGSILASDGGEYVRFVDHERHVTELQAHFDECQSAGNDMIEQHEAEITRLRAELAAKSKDATRYAWLRDGSNPEAGDFVGAYTDACLDAVIDRNMGEGNGR